MTRVLFGADNRGHVAICDRCGVLRAYPMPQTEADSLAAVHQATCPSRLLEAA